MFVTSIGQRIEAVRLAPAAGGLIVHDARTASQRQRSDNRLVLA